MNATPTGGGAAGPTLKRVLTRRDLILYGLVRFAVEFVRMHDSSNPLGGPFTLEQWISLCVAAAGAFLLFRRGDSIPA